MYSPYGMFFFSYLEGGAGHNQALILNLSPSGDRFPAGEESCSLSQLSREVVSFCCD